MAMKDFVMLFQCFSVEWRIKEIERNASFTTHVGICIQAVTSCDATLIVWFDVHVPSSKLHKHFALGICLHISKIISYPKWYPTVETENFVLRLSVASNWFPRGIWEISFFRMLQFWTIFTCSWILWFHVKKTWDIVIFFCYYFHVINWE